MTSKLKCPVCQTELEQMHDKKLLGCPKCLHIADGAFWVKAIQAKQDLEIARKALEYYADSRFGRKQDDGTYVLEIDKGCGVTVVYTYDPRPAKQALEQINHIADVSKMVGQN